MPEFHLPKYRPQFPFKNGHINTIYPALFRSINDLLYDRERITLDDDDFIDLDYSRVNSKKAIVLCHGLEGSAQSKYMLGMARYANKQGFDTVSVNYRGCSGEMNRKLKMYNSGATDDLHQILTHIEKDYQSLGLIGYSLGGNLILKYLGEEKFELSDKIQSAVAFSTPCHLISSIYVLETPQTAMYKKRFLVSLFAKIREKHKQYPDYIELAPLKRIKTLREFDDHYTAPIHGYKDAEDYYTKCSSKQFLENIRIPSLLVNAADDPFLSPECMAYEESNHSKYFHFHSSDYGGHVGFAKYANVYWSEEVAIQFINQVSQVRG